ncbi:MAG TPA: hypothetical protein PLO61_05200 [Fimbriimonadaceae bacterium]|nr:hypothetical protein [Fimbriimonadaceae bacterium]HRJ33092.1 hypothetical protein [Fimbriimonadaceae bacterium]
MKRFVGIASALLCVAGASATTLTFGGLGLFNGNPIPNTLGSNAASPGDGYVVGLGWTPNVSVQMATTDVNGAPTTPQLSYWFDFYGSLFDVAYPEFNGAYARVTLTADPGFLVKIESFKLGGWPGADQGSPVVEILDGGGAVLWSQNNAIASGTSFTLFTPAVEAQKLTLVVGNNWNVGLDDLSFTQRIGGSPTNTVTGTVDFGQLTAAYNTGANLPSSIPVSFRDASNAEIATGSATYDPVTGAFSATVPGSVTVPYRVSFKQGFWLRKTMPNPADPAAPLGNYNFGTVTPLVGDSDLDNEVTNFDYSLWAAANGNSVTANTDNDFDGDGEITNFDYSLWAANNGALGDN